MDRRGIASSSELPRASAPATIIGPYGTVLISLMPMRASGDEPEDESKTVPALLIDLGAGLGELAGLVLEALFEGVLLGVAVFLGVLADVVGDFHRAEGGAAH